eukprot:6852179-Alexandrium_andersonii.AAC.1
MRRLSVLARRPYFRALAQELNGVDAADLLRTGQILGDHAGIRAALQSKDIPRKVRTLLRQMQLAQQSIPYTDAYRRALHRKFTALRIWTGASLIFWTLNPADTKHPFTIAYAAPGSGGGWTHRVDLNAPDEEQEACRQ